MPIWTIRGYTVTLSDEGVWECDCPTFTSDKSCIHLKAALIDDGMKRARLKTLQQKVQERIERHKATDLQPEKPKTERPKRSIRFN